MSEAKVLRNKIRLLELKIEAMKAVMDSLQAENIQLKIETQKHE